MNQIQTVLSGGILAILVVASVLTTDLSFASQSETSVTPETGIENIIQFDTGASTTGLITTRIKAFVWSDGVQNAGLEFTFDWIAGPLHLEDLFGPVGLSMGPRYERSVYI